MPTMNAHIARLAMSERAPLRHSRRLVARSASNREGWSRALHSHTTIAAFASFASFASFAPGVIAGAGQRVFRLIPVSPGCSPQHWYEQSYHQLLSEWASGRQRRQRARTRRA